MAYADGVPVARELGCIEVRVRFLQIVVRDVCKLDPPLADPAQTREAAGENVAALEVAGTRLLPGKKRSSARSSSPSCRSRTCPAAPVSVPVWHPAR